MHEHQEKQQAEVDALIQRAWSIRNTDTRQALELSETAYRLSSELKYKKGLAHSLQLISKCHFWLSNYEVGLVKQQEAFRLFEDIDDIPNMARMLYEIGVAYGRLDDHSNALDCHFRSLNLFEQIDDLQGQAMALSGIGLVHENMGDYEKALGCFDATLGILKELDDQESLADALNNVGRILYEHLKNYKEALVYLFKSLEIYKAVTDKRGQAETLYLIGEEHRRLGEMDKAQTYLQQGLRFSQDVGEKYTEAKIRISLGRLYLVQHQKKEALQHLTEALNLAKHIKSKRLAFQTHKVLSETYKELGQLDKALDHYEQFHTIKEAVFNEETNEKLRNLQVRHQIENAQKEAEIYRLKNVELAEALAHLERLNHEKSEILGIAAHDLKNPLSAIRGTVTFIRDSLNMLSSEEIFDLLSAVEKSANRMFALIKNLLDVNALESGEMKIKAELFDLRTAIRYTIKGYSRIAEAKQICFHEEYSVEKPTVYADFNATGQVLDNLISNALKYTPPGRNVFIRLWEKEESIILAIKDEGLGLTESDKEKLFGKFARLSAKPTGGEHSTGLGLSIVKKLIELMDGHVWAESPGKNQGSTFFIELPKHNPTGEFQ